MTLDEAIKAVRDARDRYSAAEKRLEATREAETVAEKLYKKALDDYEHAKRELMATVDAEVNQ